MTFWDGEPAPPRSDSYAEMAGDVGPPWTDPMIDPVWPVGAKSIAELGIRTRVVSVEQAHCYVREEIVDPGASLEASGPSGDVYARDGGADLEWSQHFTRWCREQPDPALAIREWTRRIRLGGEKDA